MKKRAWREPARPQQKASGRVRSFAAGALAAALLLGGSFALAAGGRVEDHRAPEHRATAHDAPLLSYSVPQAAAGRQLYAAQCATCHGLTLQGAAGPAMSGLSFEKTWMNGARTARNLFDVISTTMPVNHPGSLKQEQVLELIAFILSRNGVTAGAQPLALAHLDVPIPVGSHGALLLATAHRQLRLPEGPSEVGVATGTAPTDADLLRVAPGNWLTFNRDYAGDRFSPLREINTGNVARLQPRCMLQLGEIGSFETSPIVYEGTMYLTTVHKIFAVDGASCAVLWSYTYAPVDPEHIPGNRGVALYHGKVYRGTSDGYLLCFDARTGKLLWTVHIDDGYGGAFVSGAPLAFDGKIFVGEGGADSGIHGRFYAFDSETGQPLWTFDIIPAPEGPGSGTWGGAKPRGGSSWSSMALDPQRRLLFVPTGNPGPDFDGSQRPGANLYTDSVVVLDADTGRLAWYVQQVPHDIHDWDTAAAPVIYDRGGTGYMAVASKDGFLHLYDRGSHRAIARTPTTAHFNVDVSFSADHPVTYCPGGLGQWNGPAYDAELGLLFVGSADRCDAILGLAKLPPFVAGQMDFGARLMTDRQEASSGWIRGIEAETGKPAWVYHASTPIVAAMTPTAGGLLLTGDLEGNFLAMDARSGRVLYRFMTGGGIAGGITTYEAGGRQLIAVPSGNSSRGTWGSTGSATLIVFGLP